MIEKGAGEGSGFPDELYVKAGGTIAPDADATWRDADMILKVKEPIKVEWPRMEQGQTIFTYFHFAADEELTKAHVDSGATCIAYETVQLPNGELPLLTPMSEVAGRMAVQEGAKYLEKLHGGRGVLLGGVPGVPPGKVVILGGGVVGTNAAKMAAGLGAQVTILDLSLERLRYLSRRDAGERHARSTRTASRFSSRSRRRISWSARCWCRARRRRGSCAARISKTMQPGAVIVDVAIDQGGCIETIHATTHDDPVYTIDGDHPLRRGEHAGWRAAHVDAGAHERDVPVRDAAREEGVEEGAARERARWRRG